MTRLFCILLTLLFSLSGPAMGEYSDFGCWSNAANTALNAERSMNPALSQLVPPGIGGSSPTGFIWHHATIDQGRGNAGMMQLVPTSQNHSGSPFSHLFHPLPGGAGGYWEWARPAGAPQR